jgi:phosphopantetheine adenylyltransferase
MKDFRIKDNVYTTLTTDDYLYRNGQRRKIRVAIPLKVRLHLIEQVSNICERCNNYYETSLLEIHHVDGNPSSDDFENLLVVCANCHLELKIK